MIWPQSRTERVPKPWLSDEIDQIRKAYRKCHANWTKTHCETDWQAVQKAHNAYVKALNQAKKLHFSTKTSETEGNLKKLYDTINGLTNRVNNNSMLEGYTYKNWQTYFIWDYFHSKVKMIADGMRHIPNYIPPTRNVPQLCTFDEVDLETIISIIVKIGLKQCEQDTLSTSLIKENVDRITEHMHVIINKSLHTGTFPQSWKKALVKPLIKSVKNGTVDKNYRPVSNLKFFSKLIENVALQQIVYHCEKHNLLSQNQSAYRKGYSCETMLIKLVDNILNGMENKYISAVIACDLRTAFDTINFEVLLATFKNYYRISGLVLDWIKSYLTDCPCSVIINNKESDPKSLTLSVPQGSCSGAYFFIMYASTLFEVVQDVQLFGFADDHILNDTFQAGDRTLEMNTIVRLENTLTDTKDWMDTVKLKMNLDKTEFIYFGHKQQLNKCLISLIDVTSDIIKHTECIRYLGGS